MFGGLGSIPPTGIIAAPVNTLGFDNATHVWTEPLAFAKRFPVPSQQYTAFQPQGKIVSTYPQGWHPYEMDFRFIPRFPVQDQAYTFNAGKPGVSWF